MDEPKTDPIPTDPGARIAQGIQALEEEAARQLDQARAEGARLMEQSRREAQQMAAAALPSEDIVAECLARVETAHADSRERAARAEAEAAALRERSADRIDALADEIVRIVSGAGA